MPSIEKDRPWRGLYSTKEWYRLRWHVLQRDSVMIQGVAVPRCRQTGVLLTGKAPAPNSPIVDHIKPHKGDLALFFNINNCQTVSKAWHDSVKRKWEMGSVKPVGADGWPIEEIKLGPSRPALTIVCGPPAAGKSTYIAELMLRGDVLVDADVEAARLGIGPTRTKAQWDTIIAARDAKLATLQFSTAKAAWFAVTGADARERARYALQLRPVEIVILATPAEECLRRVRETRPDQVERLTPIIDSWWSRFEATDGETIIQPADPSGGRESSFGALRRRPETATSKHIRNSNIKGDHA